MHTVNAIYSISRNISTKSLPDLASYFVKACLFCIVAVCNVLLCLSVTIEVIHLQNITKFAPQFDRVTLCSWDLNWDTLYENEFLVSGEL